ncbi:MAG: glutamine synthetase type III [Planctomycetaceae bacterium]|nr:glutamine synthetase type III [Planctomycetaceae bacterium]
MSNPIMMATTRQDAIRTISSEFLWDLGGEIPENGDMLPDCFGKYVFNDQVQRQRLPKPVYSALRKTIETGAPLDPDVADSVAAAMKDWAVEHGATHYTHWFQPMTGSTAEKHDSFLNPTDDGGAILEFSGRELSQGEPDASSFPTGGLRATFEARGYTAWDPTSPAFLRKSEGGATLTIPTAFCSWTGEALDKKTPLLRSCETLSTSAVRLLNLIGESHVSRVMPSAGTEQEYFLIDRQFYRMRPDLVACGRTLFGARAFKGQEFDDHYFGNISQRVLRFMHEMENELWMLGVPAKTRHNEVAPSQFELAPVYSKVSVATDQNMLTMDVIKEVAERHGLTALMHEKPFARLNGSGKHLNWSLGDNAGKNLLDPGSTPHENLRFILTLTAIIRGVDLHQDLLRASIASAGNDHRLGANEAPPAIISIFVGQQLEEIVQSIIEGRSPVTGSQEETIRLGVTSLPELPRDISDRNRTSPFAFTGNKFEFRAVASSQSVAYPAAFINMIVAESMDYLADQIEAKGGPSTENIQAVVREALASHQRILFSGDNYSAEWREEAARRGLHNRPGTPEALSDWVSETNLSLYERYGVFSRGEAHSRLSVQMETYANKVNVEAIATRDIAMTMILPAAMAYQKNLADSIAATEGAMGPEWDAQILTSQREVLALSSKQIADMKQAIDNLLAIQEELEASDYGEAERAHAYRDRVIPAMDAVRECCDLLERLVSDSLWPLPKYREMLFIH